MSRDDPDAAVAGTAAFQAHRGRLFAVAYHMLGSASDAEDVVQDAYLRWHALEEVRDPEAFLVRVVTRLCLDELAAARRRRECYVGPWLPEPLLTGADVVGPAEAAEQRESISLVALWLLERLTALERAVLVLRDVAGYSYADLAELLERTEVNCRQLHSRARTRLDTERPAFVVAPGAQAELTRRLVAAVTAGDAAGLQALLAADAAVWTDGGGKVRAALRPVHGREAVAHFLLFLAARGTDEVELRLAQVNGQLGVLALARGRLTHVGLASAAPGGVGAVYVIANPDKLRYAAGQLAVTNHGPSSSSRT